MAKYICPYCGSTGTTKGIGAFLEIGSYEDNKGYPIEGDADMYTCKVCEKQFWVNGPRVDVVYIAIIDTPAYTLERTHETMQAAREHLAQEIIDAGKRINADAAIYEARADEARTFGESGFNGVSYKCKITAREE